MSKAKPENSHLLRFHIISAQLKNATQNSNVHCVVKVGKGCAKTLSHPLTGSDPKEVVWQEDFILEYNDECKGKNSLLEAQVFAEKDLLGTFSMEINPNQPIEEEIWSMIKPTSYPLCDSKGNSVGTINLRIRHEFKILGTLTVVLKEGDLEEGLIQNAKSVTAIVKHTNQVFKMSPATVNGNHFIFSDQCTQNINIDKDNNVFDVFIEIWKDQITSSEASAALTPAPTAPIPEKNEKLDPNTPMRDTMIGQARITLFDVRSPVQSSLPIFTADHRQVGHLQLQATLKEQR